MTRTKWEYAALGFAGGLSGIGVLLLVDAWCYLIRVYVVAGSGAWLARDWFNALGYWGAAGMAAMMLAGVICAVIAHLTPDEPTLEGGRGQ